MTASALWSHDNLHAWCVVPFDANKRGPDERARMLARLGFRAFAYDWRAEDVEFFEAEIEALNRHDVGLLAWWWMFEAGDATGQATLELFGKHGVQPQLWVMQAPGNWPKTADEWHDLLGPGVDIPADWTALNEADREAAQKRLMRAIAVLNERDLPRTATEQDERIERETDRIEAIVKQAAPFGCRIELYNHNGWFGIIENELAILDRLRDRGITEVGLVYNFSHCRDELHDDTADFPALWKKMQPHVDVINIAGTHFEDGSTLLPGEGDSELEMMRTIQGSGWRGRVGLIAESGGDAEMTLRNCMAGLAWLAAEIEQPGSGGAAPFPPAASTAPG